LVSHAKGITYLVKRVLRRTLGPRKKEVAGGWRRLNNEKLHNLYASPNIFRVIKSRRMGCAVHVARVGETRRTIFWLENVKGKAHLEDLGVDGKIILVRNSGIIHVQEIHRSKDSSVNIVTRLRAGRFLFPTASRLPLLWDPPSLASNRYRGLFPREYRGPGSEANHSPPTSAEVKNAWSYTSTPTYVFMARYLVQHRDNLTFTFILL
jgi:hypothetical protein